MLHLRLRDFLDVVCCDGVGMAVWPFSEEVTTANGFSMSVRRKTGYNVIFGETTTESCDYLATDGLVHYVDKVSVAKYVDERKRWKIV